MNDRLCDLKGGALADDMNVSKTTTENQCNNHDASGDLEMQTTFQKLSPMDHFFKDIDSIMKDMEHITKATQQIRVIKEEVLLATTTQDENKLSNKLRSLLHDTNNQAKRIKALLGFLKKETDKLKTKGKINSADLR